MELLVPPTARKPGRKSSKKKVSSRKLYLPDMTEEEIAKKNYKELTFPEKFIMMNRALNELNNCRMLADIFKVTRNSLKSIF
mmetsp:Transcript_5891/g.9553  ORF Transcript_5891/g.9553 Transcript_5891/m.9553 type:complete len:82 (+) Transcript_5891:2833-3078(+)